jgi:hypothetical protein
LNAERHNIERWSVAAQASAPVPKTYVGCVLNGEFKNADG